MALAVVLVVGSGLLLRSLGRLQAADPGFDRGQVLTFKMLTHPTAYPEMHRLVGFYDAAFREIRALPGVVSVAAAYDHPLDSNWTQSFRITTGSEPDTWQDGAFRTVTPEYFDTMGVELVAGRGFTTSDTADAVIVNQTFVRRHFPDRDPIGQRLEMTTYLVVRRCFRAWPKARCPELAAEPTRLGVSRQQTGQRDPTMLRSPISPRNSASIRRDLGEFSQPPRGDPSFWWSWSAEVSGLASEANESDG